MDAHKAILMQRQVRNNAEDLQKEFLDMAAWEEEMKKKDLEIRNTKDDRVSHLFFFLSPCSRTIL